MEMFISKNLKSLNILKYNRFKNNKKTQKTQN